MCLGGCSSPINESVSKELESIELERIKWQLEIANHSLDSIELMKSMDLSDMKSASAKQNKIRNKLNIIGYQVYKNASRIHGAFYEIERRCKFNKDYWSNRQSEKLELALNTLTLTETEFLEIEEAFWVQQKKLSDLFGESSILGYCIRYKIAQWFKVLPS